MNEPTAVLGTSAPALLHPTLDGGGSVTAASALAGLDDVRLTDQQRLGVVLQAAALLGHCEHAGLRLAPLKDDDPWRDARVDPEGRLCGLRLRPGRDGRLPQTLLLALLHRLFRSTGGSLAGRGGARRVARELIELWSQELEPQSPDQAVGQILDSAPFLWADAFLDARLTLAAGVMMPRGSDVRPWLAAPGRVRRRFLQRVADEETDDEAGEENGDEVGHNSYERLVRLLRSPAARDIWDGIDAASDPRELRERGALSRAAAAWERRPSLGRRESLEHAVCLAHLGRFEEAVDVLRRVVRPAKADHGVDAETLLALARCQLDAGERRAADKTLRPLRRRSEELGIEAFLYWAEVEVRLAATNGSADAGRAWTERLLALADAEVGDEVGDEAGDELGARHRQKALILAAGAAFDRRDVAAMALYLGRSRPAGTSADVDLAGRWLHMEGLRRLHVGDGPGAAEHVGRALAVARRGLSPARAGRLWNDLAVARALGDDLPAAERACRHALRLLSRTQGPARLTLALYNLAEVRLRRGSWKGVVGTLERSTAENRRSGNQRGLLLDLELWTRVELAQGRAAAVLARCAEARDLIAGGAPGRSDVFDLLAARALGWLRRAEDAAMALDLVPAETLLELEPEERPAIWALAGRLESAAAEAHSTPWEPLWTALAAGEHPALAAWVPVDVLEPYRAARLVLDVETLLPGATPSLPLRRAVQTFRALGVEAFAEALETQSTSPWLALREYLDAPRTDLESAARLLRSAGYGDVRVEWTRDGRHASSQVREPEVRVLVAGRGGEQRLEAAAGEGDLVLTAPHVDGVLEALFALLREDLERTLERAPRQRHADRDDDERERVEPGLRDGIVGRSPALCDALDRLDKLARGDLPLLVLGESGTGKELAAQRAHRKSRRHAGPFLPINCAALSETLIQSDLFGHVRGAFTGADRDRAGVFESARGGTVFLDEIGDLPLTCQGKLLRVLQEGEIRRVGESFARKVDVRVVTATHRDLAQMVKEGEFRQDLFYRLRVAKVELPPLRARGDDLVRVADYLLRRIPAGPQELSAAAVERLRSYAWPGNIREMRNILEVAAALCDGDVVTPEVLDLPPDTQSDEGDGSEGRRGIGGTGGTGGLGSPVDYHREVEALRRRLVSEALETSDGNRAEAARQLGMTRQALSYLVKQLGLS